jgi:hypothetical protein
MTFQSSKTASRIIMDGLPILLKVNQWVRSVVFNLGYAYPGVCEYILGGT